MHSNCGITVINLWFWCGKVVSPPVDIFYQLNSLWNYIKLSTKPSPHYPQTFPPICLRNYPSLNTFFTQFPHPLLLTTLIKKKGL
mgnify:CR=1 FL=1